MEQSQDASRGVGRPNSLCKLEVSIISCSQDLLAALGRSKLERLGTPTGPEEARPEPNDIRLGCAEVKMLCTSSCCRAKQIGQLNWRPVYVHLLLKHICCQTNQSASCVQGWSVFFARSCVNPITRHDPETACSLTCSCSSCNCMLIFSEQYPCPPQPTVPLQVLLIP
jgi:hypothetical protein